VVLVSFEISYLRFVTTELTFLARSNGLQIFDRLDINSDVWLDDFNSTIRTFCVMTNIPTDINFIDINNRLIPPI
jgi:hypothetical protein